MCPAQPRSKAEVHIEGGQEVKAEFVQIALPLYANPHTPHVHSQLCFCTCSVKGRVTLASDFLMDRFKEKNYQTFAVFFGYTLVYINKGLYTYVYDVRQVMYVVFEHGGVGGF